MAKSKRKRRSEQPRGKAFVRDVLCDALEADDEEPIDVLWRIVEEAADPGGDLARLAAYDLDPSVSQTATTLLMMGIRHPAAPARGKPRLQEAAAPVLIGALEDSVLPDDRKYWLCPAYVLCGHDVSQEELRGFFKDYDAIHERCLKEMIAEVSDQPSSVRRLIESLGSMADDDVLPRGELFHPLLLFCADLAASDRSAAAAVAGAATALAVERGATEATSGALDILGEAPCPRSAWCLGELGRWPGMGEVGAMARQLAAEQAAAGVAPRATVLTDFSHGFVTSVDGSGSRAIHLLLRTPEGGMDAVNLMLSDRVGVRDAWYLDEGAGEIESTLHDHGCELQWAPCTVLLARELVADAWAVQEELDQPFPWQFLICRPCLGEEPIEPLRRTPNLGAYMLEIVQRSPDLFKGSEKLADEAIYGGLFFVSDAAYDYVDAVRPKRGRQRLSKKKLDGFIREVAILDKEMLLGRMAANLELESIAGRATQKQNRVAARTWLGLTEDIVPFHEVPFIRALAELSTEIILDNLKAGLHSQVEAERAALELEAALDYEFTDEELDDEFFGDDELPF